MYSELPLWLSILFVGGGLWALSWSANKFIDGASTIATSFGISPFVVGMVIIGFGTSAPELAVSAMSGAAGHSDLSLGNAFGSDIFNIAGILGIAALIWPIKVKRRTVMIAIPMLLTITLLSFALVKLGDGFTRTDGFLELALFAVLLPMYCWFDQSNKPKRSGNSVSAAASCTWRSWFNLFFGLALLIGSSHVLVWGSVDLARRMGVSELMIGLTIVAIGTSLPELASAIVSARRHEPEFVLGNIVGSNFFNTLAVVGLAGSISPFKNISPYLLTRDLPILLGLTFSVWLFGWNWRHQQLNGRISRWEGIIWILIYVIYLCIMIPQEIATNA